jgi:hypothetical protein
MPHILIRPYRALKTVPENFLTTVKMVSPCPIRTIHLTLDDVNIIVDGTGLLTISCACRDFGYTRPADVQTWPKRQAALLAVGLTIWSSGYLTMPNPADKCPSGAFDDIILAIDPAESRSWSLWAKSNMFSKFIT